MHKSNMIELFNSMGMKFKVVNCVEKGLIYRTVIVLNKKIDYIRDGRGCYYCFIFDKEGKFEEEGLIDERW